jgi:hypothetical protein
MAAKGVCASCDRRRANLMRQKRALRARKREGAMVGASAVLEEQH